MAAGKCVSELTAIKKSAEFVTCQLGTAQQKLKGTKTEGPRANGVNSTMNATTASVLNQDVEIFAPRRVSCSGDDTSPIRLQIKRVCCKGKDTVTERTPLGS